MAKVLVTGGAGYIGSHTVQQLIDRDHQVVVLDNLRTGHQSLVHPDAQFVEGDVRNRDLVAQTLKQYKLDSVVHFAGLISVEESLRLPEEYYSNNFVGTVQLLQACSEAQVQNFIFSSTAAIYEPVETGLVGEDSLLGPETPYGKSKMMSEKAIQDHGQSSKTKFMILRYFNVSGASLSNERGQKGDFQTALIKRAALAAVGKTKELQIFGTDYPTKDGTAIRDYIHVEDLANIHVHALEGLEGGLGSQILNCGYGSGFSVREVIEMMKTVSGRDFPVREVARRPGDLTAVVADNRKLLKVLSWKPQYNDLELICRTAFAWEQKQIK